MNVKRWAVSVGAATVLVGGGLTAAAVGAPYLVGAQEDEPALVGGEGSGAPEERRSPGARIRAHILREAGDVLESALDDLVGNGTLDEAQADAVRSAVEAEVDERMGDLAQRLEEHRAELEAHLTDVRDTVAEVLGMTGDELADAIRSGQSVEDIIAERGLDADQVTEDLIEAANARIDEAVAAGELAAERAEALTERVPDLVERLLDESIPPGFAERFGPFRGPGPFGFGN